MVLGFLNLSSFSIALPENRNTFKIFGGHLLCFLISIDLKLWTANHVADVFFIAL
jgi:hypothetical protein